MDMGEGGRGIVTSKRCVNIVVGNDNAQDQQLVGLSLVGMAPFIYRQNPGWKEFDKTYYNSQRRNKEIC